MGARRSPVVIVVMALAAPALGQVTFPNCYVANADWTSGSHHFTVPQPLYSPGETNPPLTTTGTADTKFVSATEVHLTPGFHAGDLTGDGQFHAYIAPWVGDPDDLVVIAPDPSTHIVGDVLHVEKWEKLELGYRLPQEYRDAIEDFFEAYYPNPDNSADANVAVPGNVDAVHHLNPYADDSLQLVMTLLSPSGVQRMKWGFYMKEAEFDPNASLAALAELVENGTSTLAPFNVRFRFSPDEEGVWQFALSIKGPYTLTASSAPLPDIHYSGYAFICDPPLPDNLGPLSVNPNNDRTLWFDGDGEPNTGDETTFYGLGVNMSDVHHGKNHDPGPFFELPGHRFYRRDFETMQQTMDQLHDVGGNFMRMFLMRSIFAPEWVNVGVYDAFKTPQVCDPQIHIQGPCNNEAWTTGYASNNQWQCWAFDQMLDHAREKNIYIQLCIDPYPPIIGYERYLWGAHPYVMAYLENSPPPQPPLAPNRYDMKRFFYSYADPDDTQSAKLYNEGAFYYWKRKYKYIMCRWGYSVNLPIIEPFNEPDQMLSYRARPMLSDPENANPCDNYGTLCVENRLDWVADELLPVTYDDWLTDLIGFIKDPVVPGNPVYSPLGEEHKMFITGTGHDGTNHEDYFRPCKNPKLDLVDVHTSNQDYEDVRESFEHAQGRRDAYPNSVTGKKRPFHHGEYTSYADKPILIGTEFKTMGTYPYFANYNISFHNELWASAFFGNFTVGTTWGWERVFWWPDALEKPLTDIANLFQGVPTAEINQPNYMDLGFPIGVEVINRPVHHQFEPLADLLNNPNWLDYDFFAGDFSVHRHTKAGEVPQGTSDEEHLIECYWLLRESDDPALNRNLAIGWVHNMNAYWDNAWYMKAGPGVGQEMLDCSSPLAPQSVTLAGFAEGQYHITFIPTWNNSTEAPDDGPDTDPDQNATTVTLDLLSNPLSSTVGSPMDTLHSDYAFVITLATEPFVKSLQVSQPATASLDWDFSVYPNPANDQVQVQLPDDKPKDIALFDLAGRQIRAWRSVKGPLLLLPLSELANGSYWVRVSDGASSRTKRLIVQ